MASGDAPYPYSFQEIAMFIIVATIIGGLVEGALPRKWIKAIPTQVFVLLTFLLIAIIVSVSGYISSGGIKIEPKIIQTIFLPSLVFVHLFELRAKSFMIVLPSLLWLVGPILLLGSALVALYPAFVMPSRPLFQWDLAFAFGAMMAATDPVSVMTQIIDLGAPMRLLAIIEGESLLLDGTTIVTVELFMYLFEKQSLGESVSAGYIVFFIFNHLLFSVLLGLAVGFVMLLLLRVVKNNAIVFILIFFSGPYFAFVVALFFMKGSGVLAVVPIGLLMNHYGKSYVRTHLEKIEAFFESLSKLTTIWLYALTGFISGLNLVRGLIQSIDWATLFILFVWVCGVRLVCIMISLPLLQRTGYGFSFPEALVLVWGGLRGAVSLTSALIISENAFVSRKDGSLIQFLIAGVVILNIVNGLTLRLLVLKLNLAQVTNKHLIIPITEKMISLAYNTLRVAGVAKERAKRMVTMGDNAFSGFNRLTSARRNHSFQNEGDIDNDDDLYTHFISKEIVSRSLMTDKRRHLMLGMQKIFEELIRDGLISQLAFSILRDAMEKVLDASPEVEEINGEVCLKLFDFWNVIIAMAPKKEWLELYERVYLRLSQKTENERNLQRKAKRMLRALFKNDLNETELDRQLSNFTTVEEEVLDDGDEENKNGRRESNLSQLKQQPRKWCFAKQAAKQNDDDEELDDTLLERMRTKQSSLSLAFSPLQWLETYAIIAWAYLYATNASLNIVKEMFTLEDEVAFESEQRSLLSEIDHSCQLPAQFINLLGRYMPEVLKAIKKLHIRAKCEMDMKAYIDSLVRKGVIESLVEKKLMKKERTILNGLKDRKFQLQEPLGVGAMGKRLKDNPNFYPFLNITFNLAELEFQTRNQKFAVGLTMSEQPSLASLTMITRRGEEAIRHATQEQSSNWKKRGMSVDYLLEERERLASGVEEEGRKEKTKHVQFADVSVV